MPNKIFFVSFHDRNGDIWGNPVAAKDHEEAFMIAYDALMEEDDLMELIDLPTSFFVDEMEMN